MTWTASGRAGLRRALLVALATATLVCGGTTSRAAPLPDWAGAALGRGALQPSPGGTVTRRDLLSLRDLGALSLSPNGRRLVFSVRAADMASDDYVVRWFILDTEGKGPPRALAFDGGQPIRALSLGLPYGYLPAEHALWSPDGRRIALRRREGDLIQLWTVDVGSGAAAPVFKGPAQVVAFAWVGARLVFRTGFDPARQRRLSAEEAEHGWLLQGGRLGPLFAARTPAPVQPDCAGGARDPSCDDRTYAFDPEGGLRPATAQEAAALAASLRPSAGLASPEARREAAGPSATRAFGRRDVGVVSDGTISGPRAWTTAVDPAMRDATMPIRRVMLGERACPSPACAGMFIQQVGLARRGRAVWFLKRQSLEGDERRGPFDATGLYLWTPHSGRVARIRLTPDLLEDCHAAGERLFCKASAPTQPTRIVSVDLATGRMRTLADPNPDMATKFYPRVRRIVLQDPAGDRGYAHLVFPEHFVRGHRYPVVVVLYRSAGFLRAAEPGEETPIFPLAARGYLVLSVDIPMDWRALRTLDEKSELRRERVGDREHLLVLAAIRRTLSALEAQGLADRKREAICGLSYGAELVHAALRHGQPYAAAIASQASADISYLAQLPPGGTRKAMAFALGASVPPRPGSYLAQSAWSQHPQRLRTPLLLNLAQNEALFGFEGISALQAAKRPLEVRIFPDEGHIKYHPRNLAGVYDNNIMWLDFWLKGREDPDPRFADQYVRWRKMRSRLQRRAGRHDPARPSG